MTGNVYLDNIIIIVILLSVYGFLYLLNWTCEKYEIVGKIFGYFVSSVIISFLGWLFIWLSIEYIFFRWFFLVIFLAVVFYSITEYFSNFCFKCFKKGKVINTSEVVTGGWTDPDSQNGEEYISTMTTYECISCGKKWIRKGGYTNST